AFTHVLEELQVLLHRAVSPGRWDSLASGATSLTTSLDLVCGLVAHIRLALLDQLDSKLVQLLKIVRGVGHSMGLVAEELEVLENVVDVLLLLSLGVGVVETHNAVAVELVGD